MEIEIKTEMAGSVWKIEVEVGNVVEEDEVLIVLESMKMEIPIVSTDSGVVKEIKVHEGDTVLEGDVVVILKK